MLFANAKKRKPKRKRNKKQNAKRWKNKQLINKLKKAFNPGVEMPTEQATYSVDDSPTVLQYAYPLSIGWDEEEKAFICELNSFDMQVHSTGWQSALDLGREAQRWLIELYQTRNYELPSL